MKLGCVLSSVSRRNGGIFEAERRLLQTLSGEQNVTVEVLGLEDDQTNVDARSWEPLSPRTFPVSGPPSFGHSSGLRRACAAFDGDMLQVAGLWMYPSVVAARWGTATRRPYMVTPHGMLDPWALTRSHWKKRVAGWLYEHRHLRGAACLRALCDEEVRSFRSFGLRTPVCVVPNGVDLPADNEVAATPPWSATVDPGRKVLLYLGRIHSKKGLAPLLDAWAGLARKSFAPLAEWSLVIAGWDQAGHEAELQRRAEHLGIARDVAFIGPQFQAARMAAYRGATAFVLPSLSEGVPMTVLEAWSHRLPVMMTPECHLPDGVAAGAAIEVSPNPAALEAGLSQLLSMSNGEQRQMGQQGRELVEKRYAWRQVAREMRSVYDWIAGGGSRPATVTHR